MFCPKCATQNIDGAKFCRSCGADISLVPQAMTGDPASFKNETDEDRECGLGRKRSKEPSFERAVRNGFMGMAFLLVALALSYAREGRGWWYWMLIPAFSMLGGGIAEYMRTRRAQNTKLSNSIQLGSTFGRTSQRQELPQHSASELVQLPPSVTEGTTRHLGAESPTRVFAPVDRTKEKG